MHHRLAEVPVGAEAVAVDPRAELGALDRMVEPQGNTLHPAIMTPHRIAAFLSATPEAR